MIALETEDIILRPLRRRDDVSGCDLAAAVFDHGDERGCYALVKKANRTVIGVILCPEADLTMAVVAAERDRGFGAQGLSLALDALFGGEGRTVVTAACARENVAAVKTARATGFSVVSEDEKNLLWRVTAAEWECF